MNEREFMELWKQTERKYEPGTCYRCWQIGKEGVPGTRIVSYNAGTEHEFKSASCASCYAKDKAQFPGTTRMIAEVLMKGRP